MCDGGARSGDEKKVMNVTGDEIIETVVNDVLDVVKKLEAKSRLYRGIYSNVLKINNSNIICFPKPLVLFGEVEVEDVFADAHYLFIRPLSPKAILVRPVNTTFVSWNPTFGFEAHVYSHRVWLDGRTNSYPVTEPKDLCGVITRIVEMLLEKLKS
jgi:hypothetical protein